MRSGNLVHKGTPTRFETGFKPYSVVGSDSACNTRPFMPLCLITTTPCMTYITQVLIYFCPVGGLSMKKTCLFSPYVTSTILPRHSQINSFISTYLEQSSSLLLKRSCRTCPEPENASLARSTQAAKRKGTSSSMRVSFDTFVQEVTFPRWFKIAARCRP